MPTDSDRSWVVLKFGGSSVATVERWEKIATIARQRVESGVRPLVVCSATAGTSDLLEKVIATAEAGESPKPILDDIRKRHLDLADALGVDPDPCIESHLGELEQKLEGARLIREASPRLRARVMSMGELISTKLGAAFLRSRGFNVAWQDARKLMHAEPAPVGAAETRKYLSATCGYEPEPAVREALDATEGDVVVTQGFIASDQNGDTVLLGRGGSDTSAAYFAAKIGAERLEIWTDVPGMFTANPRQVQEARLLKKLCYDEAKILASMGARVLHPRCIDPVQKNGIPLHIRCTHAIDMKGTVISGDEAHDEAFVKGLASRTKLALFSIRSKDEAVDSVEFLPGILECFKRHAMAVDLISTSPSEIRITVDPSVVPLTARFAEQLVSELSEYGEVDYNPRAASVSLMGNRLRSFIHKFGTAFERFREPAVYMVSQSANDLSLTFVVDGDSADDLVEDLHEAFFNGALPDAVFGREWASMFNKPDRLRTASPKKASEAEAAVAVS